MLCFVPWHSRLCKDSGRLGHARQLREREYPTAPNELGYPIFLYLYRGAQCSHNNQPGTYHTFFLLTQTVLALRRRRLLINISWFHQLWPSMGGVPPISIDIPQPQISCSFLWWMLLFLIRPRTIPTPVSLTLISLDHRIHESVFEFSHIGLTPLRRGFLLCRLSYVPSV